MPLHLTKVAFGHSEVAHLAERLRQRGEEGPLLLTTRYLPKRHEEIAGQGSLFWIVRHTLVGRSPILGFGEAEGGRVSIRLDPVLRLVAARPKRAHQGWRYLEHADAPPDLGEGAGGLADMPPALLGKLSELGLV